jgi:ubiquinone/menaquinone biosynthesis C-methylase UbiE
MSSADAIPPIGPASFDERAATWDSDLRRRVLTEDIAREIFATIPLAPDWRVLDYGCGTGALALHLLPRVREVVAADASTGMFAEVRRKHDALPPEDAVRFHPLLLDLTNTPPPFSQGFNFIVASLVIHHVKNIPALLAVFQKLLLPGGHLVIVEWSNAADPDEYLAHPKLQPAVHGFAPDELASLAVKALEPAGAAWRTINYFQRDDDTVSPAFLLRIKRHPRTVCSAASCSQNG